MWYTTLQSYNGVRCQRIAVYRMLQVLPDVAINTTTFATLQSAFSVVCPLLASVETLARAQSFNQLTYAYVHCPH